MPDVDEDLLDPEVRKAILPQQPDQGTDPNEVKRQAAVALEQKHQTGVPGIAGPNMAAMQPAATLPGVQVPEPQPNAQPAPPAIGGPSLSSTPVGPPGVNPQMAHDQARQVELNKGSGIDQFSAHHHIAGPILRTLDTIGSVFAPNLARFIPGTTLHHNMLEGQNQNALKQDVAQQKEVADTAHANAETNALNNPKPQKAENPEADAYAVLSDPNSTPEQRKAATDALNTVKDAGKGGKTLSPSEQAFEQYIKDGKTPIEAHRLVMQDAAVAKPGNDFDQYYKDFLADNGLVDSAHNRLRARQQFAQAGQAPQHDQRQLAVGPDGKVLELKPGMTIPQGSKTMSGDLAGPKMTADEQKRADLVENLNENLDQLEDIVNRRPELFGPLAGRMTKAQEWLGSDDQDIAALKGIEDRLGMVQQSSHGMRSAQHVAQSADSILNGFKNGADALKRSIADARKSGATFTADAQRGQVASPQAQSSIPADAPPAPKEDGHKLKDQSGKVLAVSKGGKWIAQ